MNEKLLQHRLLWERKDAAQDRMLSALKEFVVPKLREEGFRGSFPHFRCKRQQQWNIVTFQIERHNGWLAVNVGYCDEAGFTDLGGKHVSGEKARADELPHNQWMRLGFQPPKIADHWFKYESEELAVCDGIASTILSLLQSQAEPFWRAHQPEEQ